MTYILDYLASLFQKGLEYRSIGVHRSAISAYHEPIAFRGALSTVGKHPQVSKLMSGVHNLRPPKPRYAFTWDVEKVLNLFRSWPEKLSHKQLSIKVATLLGLIGVTRGAELHLFDLRYLSKFDRHYEFGLAGTVKNVREGKKPQPEVYFEHGEDRKLCPIACIDDYITLTAPWRPNGVPASFFLIYISPHQPISTSRLAGWVKEALHLADVDTGVFKAHSVRGASSSKAFLSGLSVKEVLTRGSWSQETTWQKFYHKEILPSSSKNFQHKVLSNKL